METITTNTLNLTELKAEILELNESKNISLEILHAIDKQDYARITYFLQFGETTRQCIMNLDSYRHGQNFGFDTIEFNEYGWLKNHHWTTKETISFPTNNQETISHNAITLACGKNGKWTFGLSYTYGAGAGGGYAPNEFQPPYDNKEHCLQAAREKITNLHKNTITHATQHPSPANYNIEYMNKVIKAIDYYFASTQQLTLF